MVHDIRNLGRTTRGPVFVLLIFAFCLALTTTAAGQNQKKKKKDDTSTPPNPADLLPDEQKLDYLIGEMLGAWQIGDIDKLHKTYADDVSVVNGLWAPPIVGWSSFLADYQMQRARLQQVRLDRSNTLIRIAPGATVAWACYQWDFSAVMDGRPSAAQGHTTLIFEKRSDAWVIVHNHTSLVRVPEPAGPPNSTPPPTLPPKP